MGKSLLFEESIGSMSHRLGLLHRPRCGGSIQCCCDLKLKAAAVMQRNSSKHSNDIAGQSHEIEWHVCLGDMSVQILRKLKAVMSETEHEPENFLDRIINDITIWDSLKVQAQCLAPAEQVATYAARTWT